MAASLLIFCCLILGSLAAPVSVIPDQDWGYVDVRPGAHMFWWLYGSAASNRDSRPLVMWLQGGPGGSSTGFGNFQEIGPLNVDQTPRKTTWVNAVNVLFVDNPVGTGYSYVDDTKLLTTNVTEIANDLVALFSTFINAHKIFQELPFYIFSESYGGKMTAAFGVALHSAIQSGDITVNFLGVALGDSWVSPIDSVQTWGTYLYTTSLIDKAALDHMNMLADSCQKALSDGNGKNATHIWGLMEDVIAEYSDNVNVYNILDHNGNNEKIINENSNRLDKQFRKHVSSIMEKDPLTTLMNGELKKKLNIPKDVTWGGQSNDVFIAQSEDFMKDVIDKVDSLLSSGIKVYIYNGQLDLIVDTLGTMNWIQKLQWSGLKSFLSAKRIPIYPPSGKSTKDTGAFLQYYENLSFYWILKAGHMVPIDAGDMALDMLKRITGTE